MKKPQKSVRRSRAFWTKLIGQWEGSGKSQRSIAEAAGVNVHTFQYWRARLSEGSEQGRKAPRQAKFVEVRGVSLTAPPEVVCRLRLGSELVLELSSMPPASWVRELSGPR